MEGLKLPHSLCFDGNVTENWKKFKQMFNIFMIASGNNKKEAEVQVAILLNVIGEEALDKYNTFDLSDEERTDVNKVLEAFENYCVPKSNESIDRHIFFTRSQQPGETFDEFLTSLRKLCSSCDFGVLKDSLLRDRIISGILDKNLKDRLLHEGNLSLEKCIKMCKAAELAETLNADKVIEDVTYKKNMKTKGKLEIDKNQHFGCKNYSSKETYKDAQKKLSRVEEKSDLNKTDPGDLGKGKRLKKRRRHSSLSSLPDDGNLEDVIISDSPLIHIPKENIMPIIETVTSLRQTDSLNTSAGIPSNSSLLGEINADCTLKRTVSSDNILLDFPASPSLLAKDHISNSSDEKTVAYLEAILRSMRVMRAKQKNLEDNVEMILRILNGMAAGNSGVRNNDATDDILKLLPLTNHEDMELVESELSNEIVANQMICYLQRVGGVTYEQAVKLLLRKMLSDGFAQNFSYLGQKGKLSFKSSNICKVIQDAVKMNYLFSDATDIAIGKVISNWLRHAKARDAQRKRN